MLFFPRRHFPPSSFALFRHRRRRRTLLFSSTSSAAAGYGRDDDDDDDIITYGDGRHGISPEEPSQSPLADEIFQSAHSSGGYTRGDATYHALVHALADRDPPDLPSLRALLARMRRDAAHRAGPFPERIFIPVIRALRRAGRPFAAVRLFLRLLPSFRCAPSAASLNSALAALLASADSAHHRLAIPFFSSALRRHPSLAPNLLTFNLLLKALCLCGDLDAALRVLREDLPSRGIRPDAYSYSTVIAALADTHGRLNDALALLDEMQVEGIPPVAPTFNALITALCRAGDLPRAGNLVKYMLLKDCPPSLATYNTLLHALCRGNRLEPAVRLLGRMVRDGLIPNKITYASIIDGLVKIGRIEDAYHVFDQMEKKGVSPNEYAYSSLLAGLLKSGELDRALSLWEGMIAKGVKTNAVLFSVLIHGLCHHGRMADAERTFSEMCATVDCVPNVVTYSSMVRGYFKSGSFQRALDMWSEMIGAGIEPNKVSFSILINGLCEAGNLKEGMMVWKHMLNRGCMPDVIAYSSMIKGLCKAGMVDGGMSLFNEMLACEEVESDAIIYNTLFDGLLKSGDVGRAFGLLGQMLDGSTCNPDRVTCNIFLKVLMLEGKGREFLDGLVVRLMKRGRTDGATAVVEVMLDRFLPPESSTWELVLRGLLWKKKRVLRGIDGCWAGIWR